MKMKNRKGSTLALTLIVFAVLMIFATFLLGFMVNENNQSIRHQNKVQAYYIARSGAVAAEAAILDMDEEEVKDLNEKLKNGKLSLDINASNLPTGQAPNVFLTYEDGFIVINSEAIKNGSKEVVKIVMQEYEDDGPNNEILMEHAIFGGSSVDIQIYRKPNIYGSVVTNADKVKIDNNYKGTGTWVSEGKTYTVLTNSNLKYEKHKFNDMLKEELFSDESIFNKPTLNKYPFNNGVLLEQTNNNVINKSWNYEKFIVDWNKNLTIDTTNGDIIIVTKEFENRGKITIKGDNKVLLYTDKIINNDKKDIVLMNGSNGKIDIFHIGNTQDRVMIDFFVPGNIYVQKSKLEIHYKRTLDANIYHFGNVNSKVIINGQIGGNVYIKEAQFEMHEDGITRGSLHHFGTPSSKLIIKGKIDKGLFLSEGDVVINSRHEWGGHIYYNGKNLTFQSNPVKIKGSIYAPDANVSINTDNIVIDGGIVSNNFIIGGYRITIKGDEDYFPTNPFPTNPDIKKGYKPGYFK